MALNQLRWNYNAALQRLLAALFTSWLLLGAAYGAARSANPHDSQDFPFAQPYFERVGDRDAIPDGAVTAMVRAPNGMLWLGTQVGLLRYDGYQFKRYQYDPGNPNSICGNFISALAIGHGKIWIGTTNDGMSILNPERESFQNFRHIEGDINSLAHNNVTAFAAAPEMADARSTSSTSSTSKSQTHVMWVGTQSGLDKLSFDIDQIPDQAPGKALGKVAGQTNGAIRAQFSHFTFAQSSDTDDAAEQKTHAESNRVRSLLIDSRGDLWAGTWNGVQRLNARAAAFATADPATAPFLGQLITSIFEAADGALWFGTRAHGVARIQPDGSGLTRVSASVAALGSTLAVDRIQAIVAPNADEIWLATTVGIHVLDSKTLRVKQHWLNDKNVLGSLAFDAIGSLLVEPTGLVWVGTWGGGLQKIQSNNRAFRTLRLASDSNAGLSMSDVHAVLELSNGRILVGTGGNGIDVIDRKLGRVARFAASNAPNQLSDGVVIALKQAHDGSVWVGTQRGGLFLMTPNRPDFTRASFRPIGAVGAVSDLLITHDGTLWIGSTKGVARLRAGSTELEYFLDTDNQALIGQINPLAEILVPNLPMPAASQAIALSPLSPLSPKAQLSQIWVGSANGLAVLRPGQARFERIQHQATRADSLVHNTIYGLLLDRERALWVSTEQGVDRLSDPLAAVPHFEHISAQFGKQGQNVGANLLQDEFGRIWTDRFVIDPGSNAIVGSNGIAGSTHRPGSMVEINRSDGVDIGTSWFNAYARTADGLFFSGGTEGLLVIDPTHYQPSTFQPPVVATELRIDGMSAALSNAGIVLGAKQRSFSLEFSALDYASPQSIRYAYRLTGFDRDWINPGAGQRVASYSNLWPEQYFLEVRGSNRHGVWSENVLRIPVRVLPAFWQTGWFVMACALLAIAAIAAVFRLRTRQIRLRALRLDGLVQARTAELKASNAQLIDSNSALALAQKYLLDTQAKLVFQEKMASLGQLVAGVAHEVNTPLGIAITASSFIQQRSSELNRQIDEGTMRKSDLTQFGADTAASSKLLEENLHRAANLIRQFKQVSVDRTATERRIVPLKTLMRELFESLQPLCKRLPISLEYMTTQSDAVLDSYVGDVGQIVTQLVQNALTHAFGPAQAGKITLTAHDTDMNGDQDTVLSVEICVRDTGIGMDASTVKQIFEPFFTTRRNLGNIGLGLHIAFNLATARLGGTIIVSTAPGTGTAMLLRFPIRAPDAKILTP